MAWVSLGVSALGYVGGRGFRGFSVLCGFVGFMLGLRVGFNQHLGPGV